MSTLSNKIKKLTQQAQNFWVSLKTKENKKIFSVLGISLISLIFIGFIYGVSRYQLFQAKEKTTNQSNKLLEKVSRIMILPKEVKPAILIIDDVKALQNQDQEFYKNALSKDVLLIYPDRVIIYSPSRNLIVNVAPVVK